MFDYTDQDWRVGDRAYVSGDTVRGCFSRGDMPLVTHVDAKGQPWAAPDGAHRTCLLDFDRRPLRVLRAGEKVEVGRLYSSVLPSGELHKHLRRAFHAMEVPISGAVPFVLLPEPPSPPDPWALLAEVDRSGLAPVEMSMAEASDLEGRIADALAWKAAQND